MAKRNGFTLIELLVVIAIIGVLSTIGLVIYSSTQKNGRISKRVQDLKAIQTALTTYYTANGSYPSTGGTGNWRSECTVWGGYASSNVAPGLVPGFMVAFPADPAMNKNNSSSCYLYTSDGVDYKLLDHGIAEFNSADYQNQRNLIDPARDGGSNNCLVDGAGNNIWSWAVYSSPVSACW